MTEHRWYSNAVAGDTKGFWCLGCALIRLERSNGTTEHYHHTQPLDPETQPVDDCARFRK